MQPGLSRIHSPTFALKSRLLSFVSAMLLRCRALYRQWEVPRHLYSHLQGTFLDEVLEGVDANAKDVALQQ